MKILKNIIIGIVALVAVCCILGAKETMHHKDIKLYLQKRNEVAVDIERCIFTYGPFYYKNDEQDIYEVKTDKNNTYWFRFGIIGYDVEKEKVKQ